MLTIWSLMSTLYKGFLPLKDGKRREFIQAENNKHQVDIFERPLRGQRDLCVCGGVLLQKKAGQIASFAHILEGAGHAQFPTFAQTYVHAHNFFLLGYSREAAC